MADRSGGEGNGFSRRSFLKSAGLGAAATSLVGAQAGIAAQEHHLGPGPVDISIKVNGALRHLTVEPRVTLLRALRDHLDLTGSKEVCERGGCGACTVLMDGKPIASCLMLATDAASHEITTVEGLSSPGTLTPIQSAFVECDAMQCGFCTPGFVVSSTALLARNPHPSVEEIKDGLSGNLCRCGTYGRIIEAVQKASREARGKDGRA